MTILTPNFADQHKSNGAAGPAHVIAAHEPTREGENPSVQPAGTATGGPHKPTPAAGVAPLKVALIGTAPSSRMLAPYNDPSWQIWGCSPGNMNALPRVDLWFELHSNLLWPEHEAYGRPYIEWLKLQKFPIYMQDKSLVPQALAFPKDELVAEFGDDFFTSSFAWMMALAMKMGAVEIALYGIDMASRDEYIRQRPGFFFFRYMATRRGVKVSAPHESDIMQSPSLYAYVDSTPFGRKIMARRQEVQGRVNAFSQQIEQATHSRTYLQGALEDLDYFESIWGGVCNDMGRLQYENAQLKGRIADLMRPVFAVSPTVMTANPAAMMPAVKITAGMLPDAPRRRRRKQQPETAPLENHDG